MQYDRANNLFVSSNWFSLKFINLKVNFAKSLQTIPIVATEDITIHSSSLGLNSFYTLVAFISFLECPSNQDEIMSHGPIILKKL